MYAKIYTYSSTEEKYLLEGTLTEQDGKVVSADESETIQRLLQDAERAQNPTEFFAVLSQRAETYTIYAIFDDSDERILLSKDGAKRPFPKRKPFK